MRFRRGGWGPLREYLGSKALDKLLGDLGAKGRVDAI